MKKKYNFLQKHVPIDIESLNAATSTKINETRNSIVRCHRTVILSRILFEEDKSIYEDFIPDASKLPSFVYNPKEIVPPKVAPQLLQQTSYLFSFLHKNLDKLFEGMILLLNKKDIKSINETNFKKIDAPAFHFLINSAIPSLFGYFSSKEYISLAFSFYSHVICLNSPYLTFKILYPFFTAPWIFRYFESSFIPLFQGFSRDTRVQQYFTNDLELQKRRQNKTEDFLTLSNIYATKLIDSFISNSLLLPQFFIVIIKMLCEKWSNQVVGGFLANELFKDMAFKFLDNFGYADYKEFLINVFLSISNNSNLQEKLSRKFCQINTSSFSSLEIPEIFNNFGQHYINFLCSIPEIMALEKAITMKTELPSSITGFSYETTPKFNIFFFKVFPKRYMPGLQKERNLIFNIITDEVPNNPDFERRYLQIQSAMINKQQELIHAIQTHHNTKENSNQNDNENENSNQNDNENENSNQNDNENENSNQNDNENENSNQNINENSENVNENNFEIIKIDDLQNRMLSVYDFARAFDDDKSFTEYALYRCADDLNIQANEFEEVMFFKFELTEIQKWLDIALEQERVVMLQVAEIAVHQAFMRGYETVEIAFQHASSLFKRSSIIMKDQYLKLVSKYIHQLIRKANDHWKSIQNQQSSSASLKSWWHSKRRGRHLSFDGNKVKRDEALYQFSSGSNDNNIDNNQSSSSSINTTNKQTNSNNNNTANSNQTSTVNFDLNIPNLCLINESNSSNNTNASSGSSNLNIQLNLQNSSNSRITSSSTDFNLESPNLDRLSSTPPTRKSSFSFTISSSKTSNNDSSFSIIDDIALLENEWQEYISFLSLQYGRIDTGINNKFAGSIFFESVESFRNVNMKNLSSSFKNLTSGITFLINLFESGMSKMDLIQMAIALSDNKELIKFYIIINAFAMRASSFHKLCTEEEVLAWVKFESSLLKMISAKPGSQLEKLFFGIQNKLLG